MKAGNKSEDLFAGLRDENDRLDLHWIRSHLGQDDFIAEYGTQDLWRWKANQEVDYLVGHAANGARLYAQEAEIKAREQDTIVALKFLADKVLLLFSLEKHQGPQIEFHLRRKGKDRDSDASSAGSQGVNPASKQHLKQHHKKTPKHTSKQQRRVLEEAPSTEKTPKPTQDNVPNKRDRIRQEVASSKGGHAWEYTSEHQNGARIVCRTCGLGVHQIFAPWKFDRLITHPCKGRADRQFFESVWQIHPSHSMTYVGPVWKCDKCGRTLKPGGEKPHTKLLEVCVPDKGKNLHEAKAAAAVGPACGSTRLEAPGGLPSTSQAVGAAVSRTSAAGLQAKKKLFASPSVIGTIQETSQNSRLPETTESGMGLSSQPSPKKAKAKAKAKQDKLKQTKLFFG